jgi:hypothetical protein
MKYNFHSIIEALYATFRQLDSLQRAFTKNSFINNSTLYKHLVGKILKISSVNAYIMIFIFVSHLKIPLGLSLEIFDFINTFPSLRHDLISTAEISNRHPPSREVCPPKIQFTSTF